MKKNIIDYIILIVLTLLVTSAYFIVNYDRDDKPIITGEYDALWETGTALTEITAEPMSEKSDDDRKEYVFLDINEATEEELMLLDGIGESLAVRITAYRKASGGFDNIEEIMNVSGIGEMTFSAIRDHIYVQNPVYEATEATEFTEASMATGEPVTESTSTEETQIQTEEHIIVEQEPTEPPTAAPGTRFDLNTVTADELVLIPYVDRALAESIINLRTSINGFSNVLEILYAEEMKPELYSEISEYLYVEGVD